MFLFRWPGEDCDVGIAQASGFEINAQCPIKGSRHVAHYLDRCIIHTIPFAGFWIKCLKKILIEVENRVATVRSHFQYFGRKAIHCIPHYIEADTDILHDFLEAKSP